MKNSKYVFIALGFILVMAVKPAQAQTTQPGCDAETYNIQVNKGLLQGRREQAFNQALIKKADSVLEYTCFPTIMETVVADEIAPLFSESDDWANKPVQLLAARTEMTEITFEMGPNSMNEALEDTVVLQADEYIGASFGHTYLGGYADIDYGGGCGDMNAVWYLSRDSNMANVDLGIPSTDLFYSFEELIGYDPRVDPKHP